MGVQEGGGRGGRKLPYLAPRVAACGAISAGAWLPPSDARAGGYGATWGAVFGRVFGATAPASVETFDGSS